jgi:uncharacterized protein (DUF111 family)
VRAVKQASAEQIAGVPVSHGNSQRKSSSTSVADGPQANPARMKGLIFDPFAGISGDMTLGALLDLGLPAEWLHEFVARLDLGAATLVTERVNRRGISCGRVYFELPHEHKHRHLSHIVEILDRAPLSDTVRARARDAFTRIAHAEALVHGTTIEKVHSMKWEHWMQFSM